MIFKYPSYLPDPLISSCPHLLPSKTVAFISETQYKLYHSTCSSWSAAHPEGLSHYRLMISEEVSSAATIKCNLLDCFEPVFLSTFSPFCVAPFEKTVQMMPQVYEEPLFTFLAANMVRRTVIWFLSGHALGFFILTLWKELTRQKHKKTWKHFIRPFTVVMCYLKFVFQHVQLSFKDKKEKFTLEMKWRGT